MPVPGAYQYVVFHSKDKAMCCCFGCTSRALTWTSVGTMSTMPTQNSQDVATMALTNQAQVGAA